jgi:hypothetical protein
MSDPVMPTFSAFLGMKQQNATKAVALGSDKNA